MSGRWRRFPILPFAAAATLALAGCADLASPGPAPTPAPTATASPVATEEAVLPRDRCDDGRLVVGDIPAIDAEWVAGVQDALERARAWRGDARLVALQIGCRPLETQFRWEGRFYSDTAQAFFASDSGQTTPAEIDPAAVVTLPLDRVSFGNLHRSLAHAGYGDDAPIDPTSGITVRLNAPTDPFGPPGTPPDVTYHVAIQQRGETQDLFVSGGNWTIYSYQDPS